MKRVKSTGLFVNGAIAIAVGLVFILANNKAIESILSIIGAVIGLLGLAILAKILFYDKKDALKNPIFILEGLLNFVLGLVMFLNPTLILHFMMLLIGLWAIIIGVVQIIYFFKIKSVIKTGYYILVGGILFVILGFFISFFPEFIVSTVAIIIGLIIVLIGIILVYLGYQVNKNKENFTDYKLIE